MLSRHYGIWALACVFAAIGGVANAQLTADFVASAEGGSPPLAVVFTDNSTSEGDPIVEWEWDFGDSNYSNEQNPTHVYLLAGVHTVMLTVRTASEEATATKVGFMSIDYLPGVRWTGVGPHRNWGAIASSSDGLKLAACVRGGQIFTSKNRGLTWTARETYRWWTGIASSDSGDKLVASEGVGLIYTSSDSGATWTPGGTFDVWEAVASSGDGGVLAACASGGHINVSTDFGVTWIPRLVAALWSDVAVSGDGGLIAVCGSGGQIWLSADAGETWTATESNREWSSIDVSADGQKMAAAVVGGYLYTSDDAGATWEAKGPNTHWDHVTVSADGTKLSASHDGKLFTSDDFGDTWTDWEDFYTWAGIASSADGTRLAAANRGGQIHVYPPLALPEIKQWIALTGSADGMRMAACAHNDHIYLTSDRGATWTASNSPKDGWLSVDASDDLTFIAASSWLRPVVISQDSGATWTEAGVDGSRPIVACSSDGTTLVVVSPDQSIMVSRDKGATWLERGFASYWLGCESSADGTKLAAIDGTSGDVYLSTDSGDSWAVTLSGPYPFCLTGVAMSADGSKMAAAGAGYIYVSTDSGTTWALKAENIQGNAQFHAPVWSAAGNVLGVAAYGGYVFTSEDDGTAWTVWDTERFWTDVILAADGAKGAACETGGRVHVQPPLVLADFESEVLPHEWEEKVDEPYSLTVQFTDISSSDPYPIIGWEWDFGDGTISNEQHPLHEYAEPGQYEVSLIVSTAVGEDMELKHDPVVVGPPIPMPMTGAALALAALLLCAVANGRRTKK